MLESGEMFCEVLEGPCPFKDLCIEAKKRGQDGVYPLQVGEKISTTSPKEILEVAEKTYCSMERIEHLENYADETNNPIFEVKARNLARNIRIWQGIMKNRPV